jgi:hypothetical protein
MLIANCEIVKRSNWKKLVIGGTKSSNPVTKIVMPTINTTKLFLYFIVVKIE